MPIVFNSNTDKNTESPSVHDTYSTPITRSRRTLSTGSLHRLKKEVGASLHQPKYQDDSGDWQQQQQQQQKDPSGKDSHSPSSLSSPSSFSTSVDCDTHRDHTHRYPPNRSQHSNKKSLTELLVSTRRRTKSNTSEDSLEARNDDIIHINQRGCERSTHSLSPSPSLSPPPSSPTSSSESSDSHPDQKIYEDTKASENINNSFSPLSPPTSATTPHPPPSILSNSSVLYSPVSSPEGMESDETFTSTQENQNHLDTSVGRRTNTARSSHPPLAPSSLSVSSSERRGNESIRDKPRTKRRRSMGSPEQSPSPIKNDGQIKGVECPLSPSPQVSSAIDNPLSDNETTSVIKEVGLKTVFESQESSETIISSCGNDTLEAETSLPVANEDIDEPLESVETAEQLDYNQKPAISYAGLIIQVFLESTKSKMTLADIYSAIMLKHHYYRHAVSGWQNSVRNSLSLNKAFVKVDRTPDEPGHGCFWALQSHVRDSNDPLPCRKRKAPVSEVATATTSNTPRPKGSVPQKPDRATETSMERLGSSHNPSFIDSAPSPAASEDAEDLKSLRRSGRVRRPPRPKEAEEYVSLHTRQPSTTNAPLSTPPSSPAPHNQDRELTPVSAPARKRASSVKIEKSQQVLLSLGSQDELNMVHLSTESKTSSITNSAPASSIRKGVQNVDLASIPGVVTTQRIRRPPQNLAEFVSSEDFKAAPCGKRQERTLQSSSSSLLNSSNVDTNARGERKEAKRSKSESHISFCNSAKKVIALEMSRSQLEQSPEHDDLDHNPSMTDISSSSQQSSSNNNNNNNSHTRPATIPLSALSHSKRGSRDFSCMNSKKQRRDSNGGSRSKSLYSKRHSSHETPTRQQILDRRRRDGKREIMVASEDDWSDSDFDFLRDEEENYRLMRIRVRKFQKACDRWDLRDEADDGHDLDEENDRSSDEERSRVEGEKIKLLMDPSVINYGFDSCDSEYILDYHQGPLFNNITWPEFSDVKDNTNGSSSTSSNTNNNIVNNTNNNNTAANCSGEVTECLDGDSMGSITTNVILTSGTISEEVDIDSQIVAEVISALTKSAILEEDPIHPTEHVTALQASTSTVPLALPTSYTANNGRKQEADEWAQFVGNCDPKIERNSGSNRRDEVGPEVELKDISKEHVQSTSNTTGVVTAIDHEIAVESSQSQMEDITIEETPVTRIKNEIEAEDFIGWSMCE